VFLGVLFWYGEIRQGSRGDRDIIWSWDVQKSNSLADFLLERNPLVAKHVPRVIRLIRPPDTFGVGVFAITRKDRTEYYVFKEIPCDIGGRGFEVHRLGLGELYHVRVGVASECSCECLGFLRHGHCKHIQGLAALIGHEIL
jgi:hypothetical protein